MNADLASAFLRKRVLITGGLGFIGSNLTRRLVELGAETTLVDSLIPEGGGNLFNLSGIEERVAVVRADIRDREQMKDLLNGQDFLFNLAAQTSHIGSMQDPFLDLETNATSHLAILELCRKENPGIRIVYAGTRQEYGRPQYLPVDESHPLEPTDYNGVSKLAGEWYHLVCNKVYGLRTTSLRMTNVYGPRMRTKDARQAFIGWWFRQVIEGQPLEVFGDGSQTRGFNYVDDVIEALLLSAVNPAAEGQIYNLGGDEPISLLDLARMIVEINGSGDYKLMPFPEEREQIDIGDYAGDYTKIGTQLGWQPKTLLREGIARTLAFYRQYHSHYW